MAVVFLRQDLKAERHSHMSSVKRIGLRRGHAMPWSNVPSFFDSAVQRALESFPREPGVAIACWESAEAFTCRHPMHEVIQFRSLFSMPDMDRAKSRQNAWLHLGVCYGALPEQVSGLLVAMTSFHAIDPKQWPVGAKISAVSTLADGKVCYPNGIAPYLRWHEVAEQILRCFGNRLDADRCRVEYSKERKRRFKILNRWDKDFEALNNITIERLRRERTVAKQGGQK